VITALAMETLDPPIWTADVGRRASGQDAQIRLICCRSISALFDLKNHWRHQVIWIYSLAVLIRGSRSQKVFSCTGDPETIKASASHGTAGGDG
jgi:hypothetical protein